MVRSAINKVKTPGDAVATVEKRETILPTILPTSMQLGAVFCMHSNPVCVATRTLYVSPQFMLWLWTTSDIQQPGSEIIIAGLAPGASLTPTGEIELYPPESPYQMYHKMSGSRIRSGHLKFKTANGNVGRGDWNRQDGTLTLTAAFDGLQGGTPYGNRYAFAFDLQYPAEARQLPVREQHALSQARRFAAGA